MAYQDFNIDVAVPVKEVLIRNLSDWGCLGKIEQDEFRVSTNPNLSEYSL
jgi:hypothetical protein